MVALFSAAILIESSLSEELASLPFRVSYFSLLYTMTPKLPKSNSSKLHLIFLYSLLYLEDLGALSCSPDYTFPSVLSFVPL